MFWYTYILRCFDNSYYVGITNNLEKRIILHNIGKGSKYLLSKLPIRLIYSEKYINKSEARKREIQLKGWSRIKKENLIKLKYKKQQL
jgi:putative endonuclease